MGEVITTFEPLNDGATATLYISLAGAIAAFSVLVWILKKGGPRSTYNQRMMIAMLLFFAAMIAAGTAVFTYLNMQNIGTVYIYEDGIATSGDRFPYKEIKSANIIADKETSLLIPGQSTRTTELLLIEANDRKSIALSEEDYDIRAILSAIKAAVEKKK
jgi:hypothetical protein